jgi:acyl-CoA dehydrogenase
MNTLIAIASFIIVILLSGYFSINLLVFAAFIVIITMLNIYLGSITAFAAAIIAAALIIVCSLFCSSPLRRWLITKNLAKVISKAIPKLSATEEIALTSGDSWMEANTFQGKNDFKKLLELKLSSLNAEEQSFLDNETEELCKLLHDWDIANDKDITKHAWAYMKEKGFFGLVIAKKYGGKEFSAAAHSAVVKKLATQSMTGAITVMVPNSLGPGELISHYGTKTQKETILPKLAIGKEIPCFALTGPFAGSDATSMRDTGVICYVKHEGKQTLGIRLNFNKRYITLAPVATIIGVAFQLKDPDCILSKKTNIGITLGLIPRKHKGIEIGNRHLPLGIPFMNGTIAGTDVFIPLDWVIGGKDMLGEGWKMLVECLAIGRAISLPAVSDAYCTKSILLSSAYARAREQFNNPLSNFEGIEEKLAETAGLSYICSATRQLTLTAVDRGLKPAVASAIAKYHLTEFTRICINNAMDIHGGKTIMSGPKNYFGSAYQAVPICITVEGANILTRNLIIFGQGAMRSHPYILKELEHIAKNDPLIELDATIFAHVSYLINNLCKQILHNVTAGAFIKTPDTKLKSSYKKIARLTHNFAVIADISLILLGGSLKRKERLSARLADAMSYLYMANAVIKKYHDEGEISEELPLAIWAVDYCLYNSQVAMQDFFANYPNKMIARLMKLCSFPYGGIALAPEDSNESKIVKLFVTGSKLRSKFAADFFISAEKSDPVAEVFHALALIEELEPASRAIKIAQRKNLITSSNNYNEVIASALEAQIITQPQAQKLLELEQLKTSIVNVDHFNYNLKKVLSK